MERKPRRRRFFFDERHENRERWIISYADFITLLFATFVVLYAMSSLNVSKYRMLSESMENAFLGEMMGRQVGRGGTEKGVLDHQPAPVPVPSHLTPELQRQLEQRERMLKNIYNTLQAQLAALIRKGEITVLRQPNGIAIDVPATLLFPSGSATLMPEALQTIDRIGQALADVPFVVQVNGYTDTAPIHSAQFDSNWELSAMRAISVVKRFASTGIAPERLVGAGYGEFHPVAPNDSDEQRARNRRVSIIVIAPNPETNPVAAAPADAAAAEGGTAAPLAADTITPASMTAETTENRASPPTASAAAPQAVAPAAPTPLAIQAPPAPPANQAPPARAPVSASSGPTPLAPTASAPPPKSNPAPQSKPVPAHAAPPVKASPAAKPSSEKPSSEKSAPEKPASHPAASGEKLRFDPRLFQSRHD